MGYEVIVVASDWKHPMKRKPGDGRPREWSGDSSDFRHISRFPCDLENLKEEQEKWDAERSLWVLGQHPDQKSGAYSRYDVFTDWAGERPTEEGYLPRWTEEEKTHLVYWNTCADVTESPNFPSVESMAVWVMGRWDYDCRKKGKLQDPWLFRAPVRRYADALAFTARCILMWQSEEILEKLSENIDIWPEIVSSDSPRALNEQKLIPFLEKRKRRTTTIK